MNPDECQIHLMQHIEGETFVVPQPVSRRLRLAIIKRLHPRTKMKLKKSLNRLMIRFSNSSDKSNISPVSTAKPRYIDLKAGDLVRVRSREEIEATLSYWGELMGCGFMEAMWPYCGTVQKVFKPVSRFVDERDYKIKKCKGLVLLDGAICQGTPELGNCDRSCFFFWRVEWLEKIDSE